MQSLREVNRRLDERDREIARIRKNVENIMHDAQNAETIASGTVRSRCPEKLKRDIRDYFVLKKKKIGSRAIWRQINLLMTYITYKWFSMVESWVSSV